LLNVVEALVIGLPDIDLGVIDRLAVGPGDASLDQHRVAFLVEADIRAHRQFRRVGNVERAKNGGFGRTRRLAVVDGVNQHRDAQDIGQQDIFLPPVIAHLAGPGQEHDRLEPFLLGGFDLLDGRMKVPRDHLHHLRQPFILRLGVTADHHVG
jgi:hypothetical protein